jgi:hypothetical protein
MAAVAAAAAMPVATAAGTVATVSPAAVTAAPGRLRHFSKLFAAERELHKRTAAVKALACFAAVQVCFAVLHGLVAECVGAWVMVIWSVDLSVYAGAVSGCGCFAIRNHCH